MAIRARRRLAFSGAAGVDPAASAVSVATFGAVGNGTTNDTTAIRNAFASLTNGGAIKFEPNQTYIINGFINITGKTNVTIYGQNATIKAQDGMSTVSGTIMLIVDAGSNVTIRDLTVDGNRANRSPIEAWIHNFIIRDTKGYTLNNCHSNNSPCDGFYIDASDMADTATYATNGVMRNCTANNNYRQGLSMINGHGLQVIGGSYNNTNGTWPKAGIDLEADPGSASPSISDVLVHGVTFSGNDGYGIMATNVGNPTNIIIERCYLSDNALGATQLDTNGAIFRNNMIENYSRTTTGFLAGTRGIIDLPAAGYVQNNLVQGNTIRNITTGAGTYCLYIHSVAGSGNQFLDNCLQDYNNTAIGNFSATATFTNNSTNPAGGCPVRPTTPTI